MRGYRFRPLALLIACLLAAVSPASELRAQDQVLVRGTVLNVDSGEPITGANVVVQNTTTGTQTNEKGEFSLRVPNPNVTLAVSRIGFAMTTVPLNGQTTLTIRLKRTAVTLSDVVVVGYGTQKRSDITGAVVSVSPDRLEEKANTNLAQALQGSMPGVSVVTSGAGAEPGLDIKIRGRGSITASTSPLVVVDGIPYNGSLSELNPNDVESIEVLKDASAAAIYGSRGSNGVILVTSKKGAVGKPRVSYTGYVGQQNIANLPDLMNAQQFADFKCVRLRTSATQDCSTVLTATELAAQKAGTNTDWARMGTQQGSQANHDISVSGGSADTRYYLGGSLLHVAGVARNDNFDRVTLRLNLDQKLRPWISVGTNTQAARTQRDGLPTNFETAFFSNPLITPYDSLGKLKLIPWPEDPVTNNALEPILAQNLDVNKRIFSSNYLLVTVPQVKGLTYRLNAGLDLADRNSGTYWGRNTQTGLAVNGIGSTANTMRNDWTLENILNYTRTFAKHTLTLTGLYSEQSNDLQTNSFRGQGYPNDVLGYRSTLPLLAVPNYTVTQSKLLSQMGRFNYAYDDRYLLTLTTRRDGFSGFGANNKYGTFPSVALGWNVGNEKFFPFKNAIDQLKLRASVGKNGNQAIQPYQTLAQLDDRSYVNGDVSAPGYIPTTLGNPDLKWETTLARNIGMDLGAWNGRVRLSVDAYSKETSDLLLRRSISSVHGINTIVQNIGKTSNKGIEAQLSTVNLDRGGFQWRTDFNVFANRNRIVDLYGDRKDDIASGWFIGQPIDVNYAYTFAGIWQTGEDATKSAQPTAKPGDVKLLDRNGDGKIDPLDKSFIGSLEPDYQAGLTNTLKFKGFTFSTYLNSVQGVTRSNILLGTNQVFADVRRNTVYRQYWTPENPINTYPANSNTSNPLSIPFFENASFVRLQDVSLSYDLPKPMAARFGGEQLRVYVNGRNLWTSTKWTGLDPELDSQRGIPLQKVFIGGMTLRF